MAKNKQNKGKDIKKAVVKKKSGQKNGQKNRLRDDERLEAPERAGSEFIKLKNPVMRGNAPTSKLTK